MKRERLPKMDTSVEFAGLKLRNPIIAASGTYGYGTEYRGLSPSSHFGAIVTKTVTLEPRNGNPPPRLCETPSGMLNSIGLANVGARRFIGEKLPLLKKAGTVLIANIAGNSVGEYGRLAGMLDGRREISALEINVSCPNVDHGGAAFGSDRVMAARVTRAVRRAYRGTVIVKLSPNVSDITVIARSVADAGADAISLINTLFGMAIDVQRMRPALGNVTGGLSGPAIRPVALYHVHRVCRAISVPVIGLGGISTAADAVQFLLAGAAAVQIGTANFVDPWTPAKIVRGMIEYCRRHGLGTVREITGKLDL